MRARFRRFVLALATIRWGKGYVQGYQDGYDAAIRMVAEGE